MKKIIIVLSLLASAGTSSAQLVADFTISSPLCTCETVYFHDASHGGTIDSLKWYLDGTLFDSVSNPERVISFGEHTISLIVYSGFLTASKDSLIIINSAMINVSVSNIFPCQGEMVTIIASGAASYVWTPGGETAELVVYPMEDTEYVLVATEYGCSTTMSVTLNVEQGPEICTLMEQKGEIYIPLSGGYQTMYHLYNSNDEELNTAHGNNGYLSFGTYPEGVYYCVAEYLPTGCTLPLNQVVISEMSAEYCDYIKIYPNPAEDYLVISSDITSKIVLVNIFGQIVLVQEVVGTMSIDISTLNPGIYFVEFHDGSRKKILIN